MKILSLDTSATPVFAAVEVDNSLQIQNIHARVLEHSRGLSRDIILALNGALNDAGWSLDELDAIAVGLGPGSWTGLRVGLSTAKTLAQARNLPLLGVPTFDAFLSSEKINHHGSYFAIAPCRAGEIYAKSWQAIGGQLTALKNEQIITLQSMADEMSTSQDAFVIVQEGQSSAQQIVADLQAQIIEVTPQDLVQNLALLAAARLQKGERDDPLSVNPLYLAPSSAERVRTEKLEKLAREKAE